MFANQGEENYHESMMKVIMNDDGEERKMLTIMLMTSTTLIEIKTRLTQRQRGLGPRKKRQ